MKILFISVLVSATLLVSGQNNEPFATHTFSSLVASSIKSVEAATTNGGITVNGIATSEATVEMYVSPNNSGSSWSLFVSCSRNTRRNNWSSEEIKQTLEEDYTIEIKVEGEKLYVVAKPKNRGQQKLNISFKISVPKQVNSNLQTSNASIRISNLSGLQNFRTSNGSVTVENVSGKIAGSTSNGGITVTNTNDDIDIRTSNGRITVSDCSGKIVLRTSNGGVNLSNISGNISATTSNGGVTASKINGELKIGTSNGNVRLDDVSGSVNAKTSNSGVTVTMAAVSDYVTLSTSNGNINLSVPAERGYDLKARARKIETSGLANFSGRIDDKNLDGRIGNGSAKIDVSTSGRVSLSFK
jgi:DUF4097 and DUF4098 domain-containing protein YvlB